MVFEVSLDKDVKTIEAMVEHFKPYVYEAELYGMLPGSLPRLTIGGLLMRLHRLGVVFDVLTPAQQASVTASREKFEALRQEWSVAYDAKMAQELKARFTALGQFLKECEERPRFAAEGYPSAMEKRVMVEVLKDEAQARGKWTDFFNAQYMQIDNRIRRFFIKDTFCWDARVERAYPPDKFWFLYGLPPRPNSRDGAAE